MAAVFKAVTPHFNALARVGYYAIITKTVDRRKLLLHNVYRVFISSLVLLYNLLHIIRAFQSLHCAQKLVDTLFILLTTLNTLGKQLAFNLRQRRVNRIITTWNGNFSLSGSAHHERVTHSNAVVMRRILYLYQCACFLCGTLWTIFPLMNRAIHGEAELTAYFPYDTNVTPAFEITVVVMSVLITAQAYGNVTMDCIVVTFYSQAQTQFTILRHNLEHLTDINKVDSFGGDHCDVIHERFVKCVRHYEKIVWFVKEVESIFSEAMAVQFLVMVWVICMTLYKIVDLDILSMEYISMVTYLMCMAAQLFIYCYYGTQLKYESSRVNEATYSMRWRSLPPRLRRELLTMMERGKWPVEPRTAYIIPHSLETYITVLRSSYALFTFLTRK
ncbi:putative odorant receptor 92a [Aricia agestis]|uniref:putative odorant receptor 92a n=1 Tax=Aricia agestis TaxID=91739 RepID=UPI001C201A28|nr:putative odorant receptor 92a [Aricia agestis]